MLSRIFTLTSVLLFFQCPASDWTITGFGLDAENGDVLNARLATRCQDSLNMTNQHSGALAVKFWRV